MSTPSKNGDASEEEKNEASTDSEKKISVKSSAKTTKKSSPQKAKKVEESEEESEEEDNDEDEEEEEEEERKPGLLDLPVEVSGARERKKVERLALSFNQPSREKKADFGEGSGHKLGECPRIEFQLQKMKVDDLKPFHRLLFNRPGAPNEIKKNIRRFSGFPFDKNSAEFDRKKSSVDRLTMAVLKKMCGLLDLERSGTKEEIISRMLDFLLYPQPSGKAVPQSKKKKPTSKKSSSDKEEKNSVDKNANKKQESETGSEQEISEPEEEKDEEDEEDKKEETNKKVAAEKKKSQSKKPPTKKVDNNKNASGKGRVKRKVESSADESSDDEPLVKKGKQPPTDEELKKLIKSILDGANLEEITMKTVCKQVYAEFPEFDLSQRKEFIKTTVRSIIS